MRLHISGSIMGLTLMFLCVFNHISWSQEEGKGWNDGKLTWEDFQGEPELFGQNISEIQYTIVFRANKLKSNDTTFVIYETDALMFPKGSWVKPDFKEPIILVYNQVIFDIVEYHSRLLETELNQSHNGLSGYINSRSITNDCKNMIREFQNYTQQGAVEAGVLEWDRKISALLDETPPLPVSTIQLKDFGLAMNVGLSFTQLNGDVKEYFSNPVGIAFGFDFAYKKTTLFTNFALDFNKVTQNFDYKNFDWQDGQKSHTAVIDLSIGQTIWEDKRNKLTPFVGWGLIEFSDARTDDEFKDKHFAKSGLSYGINYEVNLKRTVNLVPVLFYSARNQTETNLRFRFFMTSLNSKWKDGNTFNVMITANFTSRGIK